MGFIPAFQNRRRCRPPPSSAYRPTTSCRTPGSPCNTWPPPGSDGFCSRPHSATAAKASVPYPFPAYALSIRQPSSAPPRQSNRYSTASPMSFPIQPDGKVHRLPVFKIPFRHVEEAPLLHPAAQAAHVVVAPPAVPVGVQHQGVVGGDIRLCQGGEGQPPVFSSGMACTWFSSSFWGSNRYLGASLAGPYWSLEVLRPLSAASSSRLIHWQPSPKASANA